MDVTRRYVRNPSKHGADRSRAPEAVLLHIMDEIRSMRRSNLSKNDKFRLEGEDMREDRELRGYIVQSIAADISRIDANDIFGGENGAARIDPDVQKAQEGRQSGAQEWIRRRGEDGRSSQDPQDPRDSYRR